MPASCRGKVAETLGRQNGLCSWIPMPLINEHALGAGLGHCLALQLNSHTKSIPRVLRYIHILQHAILPLSEERAELSAKAIGPSSVEGTLAF